MVARVMLYIAELTADDGQRPAYGSLHLDIDRGHRFFSRLMVSAHYVEARPLAAWPAAQRGCRKIALRLLRLCEIARYSSNPVPANGCEKNRFGLSRV